MISKLNILLLILSKKKKNSRRETCPFTHLWHDLFHGQVVNDFHERFMGADPENSLKSLREEKFSQMLYLSRRRQLSTGAKTCFVAR